MPSVPPIDQNPNITARAVGILVMRPLDRRWGYHFRRLPSQMIFSPAYFAMVICPTTADVEKSKCIAMPPCPSGTEQAIGFVPITRDLPQVPQPQVMRS